VWSTAEHPAAAVHHRKTVTQQVRSQQDHASHAGLGYQTLDLAHVRRLALNGTVGHPRSEDPPAARWQQELRKRHGRLCEHMELVTAKRPCISAISQSWA
jgi:hypothetical protein